MAVRSFASRLPSERKPSSEGGERRVDNTVVSEMTPVVVHSPIDVEVGPFQPSAQVVGRDAETGAETADTHSSEGAQWR